ncbi:protein-L-isoaspartate(D-aspartate) O-methyltransferase [Parachlamydia sp. AcF125]|uniref:protein-L-isoaspartate(D-aspartate) O-methyltransferase n=1 Tax=Parachlamydia sp. AcF125 TaxID=2795736 RepID=UPI001BC94F32|nr:protein-L-isoaspartate(D-aspartate) O-methyltransferase [Parachlamydia sp. AcF125]MBS4168003.1 Protein-L-isoaspartate O-methyltransferase [Parachlamydia sp. AcF125]
MEDFYKKQRNLMVEQQLIPRHIEDPRVLKAMREVPRHQFVPPPFIPYAYEDSPLAIGEGQTISQPYIVALMIQAAQVDENSTVLEIGTGSGYAAAVLGNICKNVYTIERLSHLAQTAQERLQHLNYTNVEVVIGDGTLGLPDKGPFDAIIITASGPKVPQSLRQQLKMGGRLIMPVGDTLGQELIRVRALPDQTFSTERLEYVRFVPLIGKEGWKERGPL